MGKLEVKQAETSVSGVSPQSLLTSFGKVRRIFFS
jgi:hypothetical protein